MPEVREGLALGPQAVAEPEPGVSDAASTVAAPARAWRLPRFRLRVWLPPLIAFAIVVGVWEWYSHTHPFVIPTIESIWHTFKADPGTFGHNLLTTLREVALGGGGGIVVAFLISVLMTELPVMERALMPLAVMLNVTPIIAIAPALVIAFGFGLVPKYLITGIIVFYPMLVNTLAGLRAVDPRTLEVFTTLHASRWERFRYLRLPSSLPFIFAGLRIALPLSVVGAAVAEYAAAGQQSGLGALVEISASQVDLPTIWAAIVILCALGVAMLVILAVIQRRAVWWAYDTDKSQ